MLREVLRRRYEGPNSSPGAARTAFDCDHDFFVNPTPGTDDDLPAGQEPTCCATTTHQLGHVLGFGTAHVVASLVDGTNHFVGAAAEEVHGGPVPLAPDGGHLDSSLEYDGRSTLMDTSRTVGSRTRPTSLDVAVMGDLGYERTPQP